VTVPKNSVASCEEFYILVVEAHVVTAAMELFGMLTVEMSPQRLSFFRQDQRVLTLFKGEKF